MSAGRNAPLLALSAIATLTLAAACSQPAFRGHQDAAPREPTKVEITLGRQWRIDKPSRSWDPIVLAGPRGELWAFCHVRRDEKTGSGAVTFARFDGKGWTPWADVAPCSKVEPIGPAGAVDGSGNPVVVWEDLGSEKPGEKGLFFTRWTGQAWTKPELLVTLAIFSHAQATVCTDSRGNVHLVYQGPLKPEESYSIGFIHVHGAAAEKTWHMIFDGRTWTPPAPTTGPGRYCMGDPRLTAEPDGKVYLAAQIFPFTWLSLGNHYAGCQAWDGKAWSALERLTPENLSAGDRASMAVDARDTKFVTWWNPQAKMVQVARKTGWNLSPPEVLAPQGSMPVLRSDTGGRALLAWYGNGSMHIVARAGKGWTPEVTFPAPHPFSDIEWTRGGPGTMLLRWATRDALYIQEVLLKVDGMPGPTSPGEASGQ
ncbi:MAG: hypothetical protein NTU94_14525 [Planctomycetota bacterium]|nr:hypothetical protein [Planctomycetota bacterium]